MRTRLHRNVIGSNQYQKKEKMLGLSIGAWKSITVVSLLLLPVLYFGNTAASLKPIKIISPLPVRAYAMEEFSITPSQPPLAPLSEREENIRIIKKIWGKDWKVGVEIAKCESGLRANAFNGSNSNGTWDAGLFQINTIHGWSKEDLFNPVANAGIAYAKFIEQGTGPWYSSQHCWEGNL